MKTIHIEQILNDLYCVDELQSFCQRCELSLENDYAVIKMTLVDLICLQLYCNS